MKSKDPDSFLVIGGCPRSGTTLLGNIFNSNKSIYISNEMNIARVIKEIKSIVGNRSFADYLKAGADHSPIDRAMSIRENFTKEYFLKYKFFSDSAADILKFIYEHHFKKINGKGKPKIVGDKFPLYYREDALFNKPLLKFKFIHITRNPFDTVNSMLRRTEMTKQGKDIWNTYTDINTMIEMWNEALNFITENEGKANFLHVQYEDLVFNTKPVISKISDFINRKILPGDNIESDFDKHFDRSYLKEEDIKLIKEKALIEEYSDYLKQVGEGEISLEQLL